MLGIVFAIISALFIGLCYYFLKISYKEFKPSVAFLFDATFGLLIWVPLAIFMGISSGANFGEATIFAVISAILSEAVVFYALSHGELAITTTILSTYPVYTVILSFFINGESLSFSILAFVVITIIGSVLATLPNKLKKSEFKLNAAIIWPFVAAICIGLSDTVSKNYINRSDDFSFLFMLGFVQIPVALAYLRVEKQKISKAVKNAFHKITDYKFALLGGLFNIIGTGFLWLSFSFSPAAIASPITGSSGAVTVLLARLLLKEKITIIKYVGIILAFAGVIGLAILRP
ncbi:MAG: DMT family transporter [Candidatus Nomurabacteria bacterium]|jgi:drug/metabolite transporter (DMT)-like permease|nr:DMT family transporter [Candidatus Nomurabacteria bacterium]